MDWDESALTIGPWISYEPGAVGVKSSNPDRQMLLDALLKPSYRQPFVIS